MVKQDTTPKLRKLFGNALRELRKSRNLSQEKLAEMASVHPTYIGVIERGEQAATLDTIEKLAHALNIKEIELFAFQSDTSDITKAQIIAALTGKSKKMLQRILDIIKTLEK